MGPLLLTDKDHMQTLGRFAISRPYWSALLLIFVLSELVILRDLVVLSQLSHFLLSPCSSGMTFDLYLTWYSDFLGSREGYLIGFLAIDEFGRGVVVGRYWMIRKVGSSEVSLFS